MARKKFMTIRQAKRLMPGALVVVLIEGSGEDNANEVRVVPPGEVWRVLHVQAWPEGHHAITVGHRSGVSNVYDEADPKAERYPFARPTTADVVRATIAAYLDALNDEDQEGGPIAPNGDDFNDVIDHIERTMTTGNLPEIRLSHRGR